MKAKAISLYFEGRNEREIEEYNQQLDRLKEMYADEVCFMDSVCIGSESGYCNYSSVVRCGIPGKGKA